MTRKRGPDDGILLCGGRRASMCELAELMFRHPVEVVCAVDVEAPRHCWESC